jgi:hypothetical protein
MATGRVSRNEIRTSRRRTPPIAADGRIARPMMASGPRYPPMMKAPTDSTVATTALVSGLSR